MLRTKRGKKGVPPSDGRSVVRVRMRKIRKKLLAEIAPDGVLTASQTITLDRCTFIAFRLSEMERVALGRGLQSGHAEREYNAASGNLSRLIKLTKELGAPPSPATPAGARRAKNQTDADPGAPSLADILATMSAT
jgi:hypothetical protein